MPTGDALLTILYGYKSCFGRISHYYHLLIIKVLYILAHASLLLFVCFVQNVYGAEAITPGLVPLRTRLLHLEVYKVCQSHAYLATLFSAFSIWMKY